MQHKKEEYIQAIENFIDEYREQNGLIPSMAEIADAIGLSAGTVCKYVAHMRKAGILTSNGGSRTLSTRKAQASQGDYVMVPVLGSISCGVPKLADAHVEEYVKLPTKLFGDGDLYFMPAHGDAMTGAGIKEGDLLVVERRDEAEYNQIVVVEITGEVTVRRYRPQPDGTVRLHPENERFTDTVLSEEDCVIQGVVTMILTKVV